MSNGLDNEYDDSDAVLNIDDSKIDYLFSMEEYNFNDYEKKQD